MKLKRGTAKIMVPDEQSTHFLENPASCLLFGQPMWNHPECGIIQERERGRGIYLLDLLLSHPPSLFSHWSKLTLRDINSPHAQVVLQVLPGLSRPHSS